jgi:hypothetical protein
MASRIFYSHAKKAYGSRAEARNILMIKGHFPPGSVVVDPSLEEGGEGKREREIGYFLDIVDTCDSLVFSRFRGVVTSGVLAEVNHALSKGKPVYELRGERMVLVKEPIPRSSKIDAAGFIIREGAGSLRRRVREGPSQGRRSSR